MSLEATLTLAAADGKLLPSSLENIQSLLDAGANPMYRDSVKELADAGEWTELNDRFFTKLKFGTGGLRGRTIGKVVTKAERGSAAEGERPEFPGVGTNAMNDFNVSRATQGLVAYCKKYRAKAAIPGRVKIVFAHDTRHFS